MHTHSCHTVSAGELRVLTQEVGVVGGWSYGSCFGVSSGSPELSIGITRSSMLGRVSFSCNTHTHTHTINPSIIVRLCAHTHTRD